MSYIAKQPNGKYCIFSTAIDCPTHINMTKQDYLKYRLKKAIEEAEREVNEMFDENNASIYIHDIEQVKEDFYPNVMTHAQFSVVLKKMEKEDGEYEETTVHKKITQKK